MSVYLLATVLQRCAMLPTDRSGVEVPANDAEQILIGRIRARWADGISFARITDQRGAAKVSTERGSRWSAWQSRKSSTVQHEDRQGAVSALCT
jgi:hypothetical protein